MNRVSTAREWILVLAITCCGPATAWSADPVVGSLDPPGFRQGSEAQLTVRGARLADAEQVLLYQDGIEIKQLEKVDDKTIRATLAVAPDCPLGIHAFRIRTASGISDLRTFAVGRLPILDEVEPNNDIAAAQKIELNTTVHGVVQNEDEDYFALELKKGQRLTAELEGLRLGHTFFDPSLAILSADRSELAQSDDAPLLRQDSLCSAIAPEDGTYLVRVRESSFGGSGDCKYRLHIGTFPRPTAVYPAGGAPGETLQVTWIGDAAGSFQSTLTLPSEPEGDVPLFAEDAQGQSPSANTFRINRLVNVLEQEPNDTVKEATAGAAPAALNGIIEKPGDVDHFGFTATKGQQYDIRVYGREPLRSPLDAVLTIRRANGSGVASNDDSPGPDSYLRFNAPEDGDYVVAVSDHLQTGGPEYVYRVEISAVEPSLTLRVPEKVQYKATTVSVPQNNRAAILISAARANFGGDLEVAFPKLPEGVEVQTVPMAADRSEIPVLFTASDAAPLSGMLANVVGRPRDEKVSVEGRFDQRTMLVRGQNNRDVWGHDAKRMALAVTQKVPYKIEIVQPKVPIVRNGSMQLKVIAHRDEGFKAPIAVSLLYNPPGIGSSGSVSIAEGKSEALIPLTANENAAIQTWPIVVLGRATVGDGAVEVASQLADLIVADRYLNLTFEKSAVEQGQEANILVKVERNKEFDSKATVELLGLPANTSTDGGAIELAKDADHVMFKVKVDATARPGKYSSLVCRAIITENDEPITQTTGGGELRIDQPLPKKEAVATPQEKPPAEAAPPKVLSRLEQLRAEKAAATAGP